MHALNWLYTYRFSRFNMFVYYFMRLQTNHFTLLTISPISFIFDSARNLTRNFSYLLFDVSWKYRLSGEMRDEKNNWQDGLQNAIYTIMVSHFANILSRSRQFDDKCIAGFILNVSQIGCTISDVNEAEGFSFGKETSREKTSGYFKKSPSELWSSKKKYSKRFAKVNRKIFELVFTQESRHFNLRVK